MKKLRPCYQEVIEDQVKCVHLITPGALITTLLGGGSSLPLAQISFLCTRMHDQPRKIKRAKSVKQTSTGIKRKVGEHIA